MTRIQEILEKAEREGAVRRVRADVGLIASPDGAAVAVPPMPPPAAAAPIMTAATVAPPSPAAPAGLTPARLVSGARLDARLVSASSADGQAAEQYRALRTRILNADPMAPINVVMITSPGRGEGKTLTTGNLSLAMGQEWHRRICVLDADLRHPQIHRIFDLPEGPGLCDVLTGRATLEDALVTLEEHHLTILPAGNVPAHPAELLGTTTMRRTIETLRSQFDRVLLDAPSATPLADVSILTPLVDRVIVVVRAGVTTKPAIHEALSSIDGSKLLGFVLNEAS